MEGKRSLERFMLQLIRVGGISVYSMVNLIDTDVKLYKKKNKIFINRCIHMGWYNNMYLHTLSA